MRMLPIATSRRDRTTTRRGSAILGLAAALILGACAADGWDGAAFSDPLDRHERARWERSHGWSNGLGFGCGWRADHVVFEDGIMDLVLDDTRSRDHEFSCGEYRTHDRYHYGRYEASLKAARGSGVVTAFFVYTGPAFRDPWHELTLEILGRDTTEVQFSFFTDGEPTGTTVDLGFDAAEDFHTYAIEWTPEAVRWFVDGELRHVDTAEANRIPELPGRIFANIWANDGLTEWAGEFRYPGEPLVASYDWIRYTPLPQD